MSKFQKGHKHFPRSEAGKQKMKEAMSGDKNPAKRPEVRAKISIKRKGNNGRLGLPHSEETKKKISEAHKGQKKPWSKARAFLKGHKMNRGPKNWNWKGGITKLHEQIRNSLKNRQWRSDIFQRDNFTCQHCGVRGTYLEADHFPVSFSELLKITGVKSLEEAEVREEFWNLNNGRTLCRPCHDKTKYGRPK